MHYTALVSCQHNQANFATWPSRALVFSNYLLPQMLDILAKAVSSYSYWRAVVNVCIIAPWYLGKAYMHQLHIMLQPGMWNECEKCLVIPPKTLKKQDFRLLTQQQFHLQLTHCQKQGGRVDDQLLKVELNVTILQSNLLLCREGAGLRVVVSLASATPVKLEPLFFNNSMEQLVLAVIEVLVLIRLNLLLIFRLVP